MRCAETRPHQGRETKMLHVIFAAEKQYKTAGVGIRRKCITPVFADTRRHANLAPSAPWSALLTSYLHQDGDSDGDDDDEGKTSDLETCFVLNIEHSEHAVYLYRGAPSPPQLLSNLLGDMVTFRVPSPP